MQTFAFMVNLTTIKQIKNFWPALRIVPDFIIKPFLNNLAPFKVSHIKLIQSTQGKVINGYIIACPLLRREESHILDKIIAAANIAERLNAKIIGLDRHASVISDKGYDTITRRLKIPVTRPNILTGWSVVEGVYRIAKIKKINLKSSTLVIIGATDSVGSLSARKLSDYVSKITIVDKDKDKLGQLKEKILQLNSVEITIEEDAQRAVREADIVINADNSSEPAFNIEELKPNTVLCDIYPSYRRLDKPNPRQDITVITAGLIKLPKPIKLGINTGLPKDVIYASLAETMLLAFKERFVNYFLGENNNPDKLEEIADLAAQHGFEVWMPEAPVL